MNIAQVLKPIFRAQQIHVITRIEGVNLLKIQLESSVAPDRAIAEEILETWQQIGQKNLTKTIIVEGWQFGETEASWQWTILKGLLSQSAIKQSPESFAAIAPLSMENITALLLIIALMMPALAFFIFRYESRWVPTFYQMCRRSPDV